MPPLEAWEKVYIDAGQYADDVHAFINCTACHGGQPVGNMAEAHTGLVASPSDDPEKTCGSCHTDVTPGVVGSLHYTLAGYDTALYDRSSPAHYDALEDMQSYHCDSCHASCGDCHVSQPSSVGGGLLEGHTYVRTPPMSRTCTGCHGSRVKNEYFGLNEGLVGDVHLRQAQMACVDCHSGDEMHGMGAAGEQTHRYDGEPEPSCESCHAGQIGVGSGILQHELHGTEILSCQACHSVAYTNCTNCHVERTDEDVPFYSVEAHYTTFLLGLNPLVSTDRPWRYVPVRHVPVDVNSFSFYGDNLLNNFLNRPTWTYATPHNIQRTTPQTASCMNCHDNTDLFLTADKVAQAERGGANQKVIVNAPPSLPANLGDILDQLEGRLKPSQRPTATPAAEDEIETPASETGEDDAGFWGEDSTAPEGEATATPEGGDDASFWGDDSAAPESEATATPEGGDDASFWGDDSAAPTPASQN